MIDYTQPPIAYLVRIPQADQDSLLHADGVRLAEEAARFLSYTPIGPVICSEEAAAVETAETILAACTSSAAAVQEDADLSNNMGVYLASPDPAGPRVIVAPAELVREIAYICDPANVCDAVGPEKQKDPVAPGGILSVHWHERHGFVDGKPTHLYKLRAVARTMVLDFTLADFVEMVARSFQ